MTVQAQPVPEQPLSQQPAQPAHTVYVGLGANLGDPLATLALALQGLSRLPLTRLVGVSSAWRSAPVQALGPDFLNAVAELSTQLPPLQLLDALQDLELRHGRERPYHHAPRTLDLDLLLYGSERMAHPRLTLPHPRMAERAFVSRPLEELAPGLLARAFPGDALAQQRAAQRCERVGPLAPAA